MSGSTDATDDKGCVAVEAFSSEPQGHINLRLPTFAKDSKLQATTPPNPGSS